MPKNVKKRKTSAKRGVKRVPARKAAAKKTVRRSVKKRPAQKRASALTRLENALLAGAAEVDELAVEMGLAGAVEPPPRKRR